MKLTPEQEKAANAIMRWLEETKSVANGRLGDNWMFILQGYAGTGKTFLLSYLISQCITCKVHCVAPTGKAASVLMSKLDGVDVTTIHKVLYQPVEESVFELRMKMAKYKENPTPELFKEIEDEKRSLAEKGPSFSGKDQTDIMPGDLVICDEASMVDARIRDDLRATGCRVLFVGDPGQLPPVGDKGWFIESEPDAMLEDIQRQALDNPIIRLSLAVRTGIVKPSEWRKKEGCGIWKKEELDPEQWLQCDQVITGSNRSRRKINRFFRNKLGHFANTGHTPDRYEKLICLANDYGTLPIRINGEQFLASDVAEVNPDDNDEGTISINYNGYDLRDQLFYPFHCLATYNENLTELPREFVKGLLKLDYAYAITCHKSQGSEYKRVVIADDKMMINQAEFRKRWLYTAVTRASETLMIIQ